MAFDFKSGIIWGVILWALVFVEASIIVSIPALANSPATRDFLYLIILPFLILFCTFMYFKEKTATLKAGFSLGLIFIIAGILLDVAVLALLFGKSLAIFREAYLWAGYLQVIAFTSVYGYYFGKPGHQAHLDEYFK